MAEKGFGVKKISFVQPSGSPTLTSPNNINLNAVNVAISTDVSIGATCTAYEFRGAIASWEIGNDGNDHYSFKGPGLDGGTRFDPDIHLVRGQKYIFHNRSSGHPFRIQSTINGSTGTQYNTGVTNNDGAAPTDIVFDVPQDAPSVLYYQCTAHPNMGGRLIIERSITKDFSGTHLTGYTVQKSDVGKIIEMGNAGSSLTVSLTPKSTSGWVSGDSFQILTNSNQLTILDASTLSAGNVYSHINNAGYSLGNRTLRGYSLVTVTYIEDYNTGNDQWFVNGGFAVY